MDNCVEKSIRGIVLGEATQADGFVVLALTPAQEGMLHYLVLQAAIEAQAVQVREVSTSGSVGDLLVMNLATSPVLALDGEELAGAKQNRILNTTVLLAGNSETAIPVSCTEQGRWAYTSSEFRTSNSFAPPSIRENTKRAVNQSLEQDRGFRTNQGEVWDHVTRLARERGVDSPTHAMSDVVDSRLPELDDMLAAIPVVEGQCGLLALLNGQVLGLDIVSRPDAYTHLHQRLVRSYLLETRTEAIHGQSTKPGVAAAEFLRQILNSEEHSFKSVGLGRDLRYSGIGVVGSALVHEGEVIHLSFFHMPPEPPAALTPGIRSYRTRMEFKRHDTGRSDAGQS